VEVDAGSGAFRAMDGAAERYMDVLEASPEPASTSTYRHGFNPTPFLRTTHLNLFYVNRDEIVVISVH
jgi:hypothetical protein